MLGSGDSPASQGAVGGWGGGVVLRAGAMFWVLGLDRVTAEDGQVGTEGRYKHPHTAASPAPCSRGPEPQGGQASL